MSQWKKVKIGDFLTEREGRFKPNDKAIAKYQRLDKIDFSGTIHLSNKPTKTDMILVQPGDLVISGINVAKGAITVYQGDEPVCATIHYSAYTFDCKKVDFDYFKFFVKSPAFVDVLKQQVKGGIKTEIKPKHFLPLEISIPDLQTQKQIVKELSTKIANITELTNEIEKQKTYAKQLRANILQDAIESKLTADWREKYPVKKGDPDYDAEALFEKIQTEKQEKGKKQKPLPAITEAEKPFTIPSGWKWVRLGEMCDNIGGGKSILCKEVVPNDDEIGIVKTGVCSFGYFKENECKTCLSIKDWHDEYAIHQGDFLIGRANTLELVGSCAIVDSIKKKLMLSDKILRINFWGDIDRQFVLYVMKSKYLRAQIEQSATGSSPTMKNISQDSIKNYVIVLPPLAEQKEIVACVEKHLETITQLEPQIATRETLTNQLMQGLLKDAFEEK